MTAQRNHPLLPHAKPLRVPPPVRTFEVFEKDDGHGYGGQPVGECTGTDPQLACAAWCKANGYGGKRRHDFYAREKVAPTPAAEARAEDAMFARMDALADSIDAEREDNDRGSNDDE